jgi:glycosyltransferase involved in cell wall biosynthesis
LNISIIIPVYNGARYINDAIESIYKTIHKTSWEVLLCNDGSTDGSEKVIKNRLFDKRIKMVYSQKENEGAAIARNRMIKEASADTIMALDCDNILCDGVVDRMYERISDKCNVIAPEKLQYFTDVRNIDSSDCWDFSGYGGICDLSLMLKTFKVPPCSGNYMYKKHVWEAVGGYHKEDVQETWGFGFRHIVVGFPVDILPNSQYLHRFCRDGYYMRLPKEEMDRACRQRLDEIKDRLTDESKAYLETEQSGKLAITSGKLVLK